MANHGIAKNAVANRRIDFLKSIGLAYDPFATPVAEQEFNLTEIPPRFYSYFTFPPLVILPQQETLPQQQDAFQILRASEHAFIYGDPGSGKTTLRLNLEADCRIRFDHTLVVTYNLGEDITQPLSLEQHWKRLARAWAIDLFVQWVEQFDPTLSESSDKPIRALRQVLALSECYLQRVVDRILEDPRPNSLAGLGTHWNLVNRSAVRYVASSEQLLTVLRLAKQAPPCPPPDDINPMHLGIEIAKQLGFRRTLVLVDGADARKREREWMMALLEPLIESLEHLSHQGVFLKFFLPLELQVPLQKWLANLHSEYVQGKIVWEREALRALLRERFRAAGSRQVGFDTLAGKGLENKLDDLIFESAQGSPRRLLQIISTLIDAHIARASNEDKFTIRDWENMRRDWAFEPPLPQAAE